MTRNPYHAFLIFYTPISISFLATLLIISWFLLIKHNIFKIPDAKTVFSVWTLFAIVTFATINKNRRNISRVLTLLSASEQLSVYSDQ